MINRYGKWVEEKDYKLYPEEKWCDYDYLADWIRNKKKYKPKTDMYNLCNMILLHYDTENINGYFAIEDTRSYPDNLMIFIPDVEAYVEASGGLEVFDWEC